MTTRAWRETFIIVERELSHASMIISDSESRTAFRATSLISMVVAYRFFIFLKSKCKRDWIISLQGSASA